MEKHVFLDKYLTPNELIKSIIMHVKNISYLHSQTHLIYWCTPFTGGLVRYTTMSRNIKRWVLYTDVDNTCKIRPMILVALWLKCRFQCFYRQCWINEYIDLRRINWPPIVTNMACFRDLFCNDSPDYFEILPKLKCINCLHIAVIR